MNTPEIFKYIRLMEKLPVIGTQYEYQREDGSVGRTMALHSNVNCDGSHLFDVGENWYEKIRFGNIELRADDIEKRRIEKIIKHIVTQVENPNLDILNLQNYESWDDAMADLSIQKTYQDYVEVCNSLRLLYNELTPYVKDYLQKRWFISGTGHSIGGYDNITDYYTEASQCRNIINGCCEEIIISVEDGNVVNVSLVGRSRKDQSNIPLLDKRSNAICRMNPDDWFKVVLSHHSDNPFDVSQINLSLCALNAYIDPKDHFVNVKKMSFHYEPSSVYLYTFDEMRANVLNYLNATLENKILKRKNDFTDVLCEHLNCLYLYLMEALKKSKEEAVSTICAMWESKQLNWNLNDESIKDTLFRYLGRTKYPRRVKFVIKH